MSKVALLDVLGREFDFADSIVADFSSQRADLEFVSLECDHIEVV